MSTLADRILAPLAGRPDADWHKAPPGRWCAGEIVNHLALSIDASANGFASRVDKPSMSRRPQTFKQKLFWFIVANTGFFGARRTAPEATRPMQKPDRAATEKLLREGVAKYAALERTLLPARAHDLFVKHPVFGDLTYGEFALFHERHAAHHLKQMHERLA